jgi:hypothetical protein
MKNLRASLDKWFGKLDERWQALPVRKQHRYTLYFFVGYLLLTIGVIFKVWYDTENPSNGLVIKHIENPVQKKQVPAALQDTSSTILKK